MISLIAAIGKNNELGKNNRLIWYIPQDLKYFKEVTSNHTIIMGRKTFESIGRILPNRKHIVISSTKDIDEVEVFDNTKDIVDKYFESEETVYVIGGASIYKQFLDFAKEMHLTEINLEDKEADVYFPAFNKNEWTSNIINNHMNEEIPYKTLIYRRKL